MRWQKSSPVKRNHAGLLYLITEIFVLNIFKKNHIYFFLMNNKFKVKIADTSTCNYWILTLPICPIIGRL